MSPRLIALLVALIPFIAINGSYLISAFEGSVPWCIPYLEGCTSVSRAARSGNAIFFFRILMLPYALLLVFFWSLARSWLQTLGDTASARPTSMFWIGCMGALALALYVDFLGTHGAGYRLVRRYGVIFFFAFTAFAQILLTTRLYQIGLFSSGRLKTLRNSMFVLCLLQIALAIVHLVASLLPGLDHIESANEWCFGLLLIGLGALIFQCWNETRYNLEPQST